MVFDDHSRVIPQQKMATILRSQRQQYELAAQQMQLCIWLESECDLPLPSPDDLFVSLQSGVVLTLLGAKLSREFGLPFAQRDDAAAVVAAAEDKGWSARVCINDFLKFARALGVAEVSLCTTDDIEACCNQSPEQLEQQ
jgi:hypothetical protein